MFRWSTSTTARTHDGTPLALVPRAGRFQRLPQRSPEPLAVSRSSNANTQQALRGPGKGEHTGRRSGAPPLAGAGAPRAGVGSVSCTGER